MDALHYYRLAEKQMPEISHCFKVNHGLALRGFAKSDGVTVTLTTIASRLPKLPAVIESLEKQTLPPKVIKLYVSREAYLLDSGIEVDNPSVELLKKKHPRLEINWVTNTGPYRKIMPYLESFFREGGQKNQLFITVDDDTLYPSHVIEKLVSEYAEHRCVVAFRGRRIVTEDGVIRGYSEWRNGETAPLMANLPTGKDGVLYSTSFFDSKLISESIGPKLAPTADDLWIKWACTYRAIPALILNPEACTSDYKSFPVVDYEKDYRENSLYAQHNSSSAGGKNDMSVRALEDWLRKKAGYKLGDLVEPC